VEEFTKPHRRDGAVLPRPPPAARISDDIQALLPLRATDATLDDVWRLAEGAGFVDVTVSDVAAIDRIEHELATEKEPAPNVPHYVVTGWKPA
jgi:hypothetical protein